MSLVKEQALFLTHLAKLILKAPEYGLILTGGELFRTREQQEIYVKSGRSKTMNSRHLRRLACDLNFFTLDENGKPQLTYSGSAVERLGKYWETLDPANSWGGNWSSFKDAPHFERRNEKSDLEKGADIISVIIEATSGGTVAPVNVAATSDAKPASSAATSADTPKKTRMRGKNLLHDEIGYKKANRRDDTESAQILLNSCLKSDSDFKPLVTDGVFGQNTHKAIAHFQKQTFGNESGVIAPGDPTLSAMCAVLGEAVCAAALRLIMLRCSEKDAEAFADPLEACMQRYEINTPLRRAHFLAQLGHESGELRWKEELASGAAYEGRRDLGNIHPGDGRKYKGRGLIQLTGRHNYTEYAKILKERGDMRDIVAHPELVATDPDLCVDTAGRYWHSRGLNKYADADDVITVTKRINGGLNGIDDRKRLLARAKATLL